MRPSTFLQSLWGHLPPAARIHVWELAGKRSAWLRSPAGADSWAGQPDVYTGVGVAAKDYGRSRRCPADLIAGIAGLWLDLDVDGGPDNKTGAIADVDTALTVAHSLTEPTVIVNSGYGLHAWYLFAGGPWLFRSDRQAAADLAHRWYLAHQAAARELGGNLDVGTRDLARLLRLPGTVNAKGADRRPVVLLEHRGPRHDRRLLERLVDGIEIPTGSATGPGAGVQLTLTGVDGGLDPDRLRALLEADDGIADAFHHRLGLSSLSEYDLSLCARVAGHMSDNDLARLIASHRLHWEPGDRKHQRMDYLRRTIARARHNDRRQGALDDLQHLEAAA